MRGTLHVTVDEGRNLKNTDTFGQMSPICTIQVGNVIQMTQKCKKGGANPTWNCPLKPFEVNIDGDKVDFLKIRVHDKDSRMGSQTVSNLVGRVHVSSRGCQCQLAHLVVCRSVADSAACSTLPTARTL
jgi:Ca2+-dependent lipid-binding protein